MITIPAYHNILFAGNSITFHSPNPAIGWTGAQGMAASTPANDFVHRVTAMVTTANASIPAAAPSTEIAHLDVNWTWEFANYTAAITGNNPDLIVIQVGDNYPPTDSQTTFDTDFGTILNSAVASGARVIVVGKWGADDWINQHMRAAALATSASFVNVFDLNHAPNTAGDDGTCTDAGVCWHPGNNGMLAIAQRIYSATYQPYTVPAAAVSQRRFCSC